MDPREDLAPQACTAHLRYDIPFHSFHDRELWGGSWVGAVSGVKMTWRGHSRVIRVRWCGAFLREQGRRPEALFALSVGSGGSAGGRASATRLRPRVRPGN